MSFRKAFVLQKLKQIDDYLEEAKLILDLPEQEILSNSKNLRTAERLCQLMVDAMIDINQHFIKELNLEVSDDLQGTFYILGENKVLPMEFAKNIAPVVGLRNRLVHRYEEIIPKIFIRHFKKNRNDFDKYIRYINDYLEKEQGKTVK